MAAADEAADVDTEAEVVEATTALFDEEPADAADVAEEVALDAPLAELQTT